MLNGTEGEVVAVKAEVPHPDYDWMTMDNDIMLIFLNGTITKDVEFVKLDSSIPLLDGLLQTNSSELTVIGWGDIAVSEDVFEMSNVFMEVDANLITNKESDSSTGIIQIQGTETN